MPEVLISSKRKVSVGEGVGVMAINGNVPVYALTSPYRGSHREASADVINKMKRVQDRHGFDDRAVL